MKRIASRMKGTTPNNQSFIGCLIILSSILNCCESTAIESIDFDRTTTGVAFSAYAKRLENGKIPWWKSYSLENVKTMLEVISSKFSRVVTFGTGAENVPYEWNATYYESNNQIYAAEAAALINKERNEKSLTMLVGMWQSNEQIQMEHEVQLALECAHKANDIYPGTVEGLIFSRDDISTKLDRAKQTLELIKYVKENATVLGLNLKLGSRQACNGIHADKKWGDNLAQIRRNIVIESDFIICDIYPIDHFRLSGSEAGFATVKNDLLAFQNELQKINPMIEVMGETGWASRGSDASIENIDNLRNYWDIVNSWASKNNFTMWLVEAFDNPWKDWDSKSAYMGWWKLRSNAQVNSIDGYAEKIFEPPEETLTTQTSPWVYVGISIGVVGVLIVVSLITMLFLRVNQLQATLTKEEVHEFIHGISDEGASLQQGDTLEPALKFPYDRSYEISKDKLKIERESLLGSGQFGCVYKAKVEGDDNCQTEVALKTTKKDCPTSALKGLLSEIKILSYLGKHPNIVSIQGAYTAEILNGIVYVATELCTLGSLEGYLRKQNSLSNDDDASAAKTATRYANAPEKLQEMETINARPEGQIAFVDMVRWSHEIACGMEYLGTKHVVHADLSTRNVLLSSDKTAKITDFGLSRRLYDYTNYVKKQQEPLPWRWMAIESLKRLEFSEKSDVWSYGVTLWEIFAMGDLPYPGLSWNLEFVDSLVSGLRMRSPPHATPAIYKIMSDCWHMHPNERPCFNDLKLSTSQILVAFSQATAAEIRMDQ